MALHTSTTTKYAFRIRTRTGLVVDHLMIHGRDVADAERKLAQMYRQCEVLDCRPQTPAPAPSGRSAGREAVVALVAKES
ncbi:MAG: hypothetical protein M5U08_07170 [Burkholderiales bacterium]|nr:hypothetical protein [Burkholderiales bacterium]